MEKLKKAKIRVVLNHPFFAALMMRKVWKQNDSIDTMRTDGKTVEYSSKFVEAHTVDELTGVVCHELLHTAMLHHTRRGGRNPKQWNIAADYAINKILVDAGLTLPKGALLDSRYDGMSAEQVYAARQGQENKDSGNGNDKQGSGDSGNGNSNDPGGCGEVIDAPAGQDAEAEADAKMEVAQAVTAGRMAGKLPGGLAELVQEILNPKVRWQDALARFVTDTAKNDYSWMRPNRRYSGRIVMPSLYNKELGSIVVMVDTSGSVDYSTLKQFAGELSELCGMMQKTCTVIYADTRVQHVDEYEPGDAVVLNAKGRGGTDFRPAFEYVAEQGIDPVAAIYLTDGECYTFPEEPPYPVLWAYYGNYGNMNVPFGEIIKID